MESGVSWLPAFMWRANKTWRGVRVEVPWVEREPAAIIRDRFEGDRMARLQSLVGDGKAVVRRCQPDGARQRNA